MEVGVGPPQSSLVIGNIRLNIHYTFQGRVYLTVAREPRRGSMIDSFIIVRDIWSREERSIAAGFFRSSAVITRPL